jgi:Bacterial Ig-like domain
MDRRRFVPSPEGLEGRALLSLFGHSSSSQTNSSSNTTSIFGVGGNLTTVNDNIPETFKAKETRVAHLPFFLERIRPGRFLPNDVISQLQTDLNAIVGQLHKPDGAVLEAFNRHLRDAEPHPSLSDTDAHILNRSFGFALNAAGATPEAQANLQADMNNLARVDANSPQPVFLATNDYALVLQTILGIGRPIARPTVPELKANTGIRVNANLGITGHHQPTLVGTYDAVQNTAATKLVATNTSMQLIDGNGDVLGSAPVDNNGDYAVTFAKPLDDGLYTFYVRAADDQGHLSEPSPPFKLKIISRRHAVVTSTGLMPPRGPLGLGQ